MPTPGNVEPAFSLGLEEEYLLVDLATRDLVSDPPGELLQRCIAETDGRDTVVGSHLTHLAAQGPEFAAHG